MPSPVELERQQKMKQGPLGLSVDGSFGPVGD